MTIEPVFHLHLLVMLLQSATQPAEFSFHMIDQPNIDGLTHFHYDKKYLSEIASIVPALPLILKNVGPSSSTIEAWLPLQDCAISKDARKVWRMVLTNCEQIWAKMAGFQGQS